MRFWWNCVTDWSNMLASELVEPRKDASFKSSSSLEKNSLATKRDSARVQQLRVEYWHEIGKVNLVDLVFVDETGSKAMTWALWPFS